MSTANKKTIYVDVDDEITGVIDKVQSSKDPIIALVLPKRATVFQSVVNMKLLRRAAEQNDKKVVLITSEATVIPLAGAVGLHVAHNLNSKPYIPTAPDLEDPEPVEISEEEPEIDPNTPVGRFAPRRSAGGDKKPQEEAIEIDNRPKAEEATAAATATGAAKKAKKDKKLKVPNFNKFRTLLIVGGVALVLLIVGLWWAFAIAPKATVTLKGETSDAQLDFDITADTAATSLDEDKAVVPAKSKELKKTDTEKAPATGQKDKGNKASGTVSLKNCTAADGALTIPAGTGISSGNFTFVTQATVTLDQRTLQGANTCITPAKDVAVVAQNPGDKYNLSARSYSVSGFNGVIANGSTMTGGTTQLVKVVSEADIEQAKQKLAAKQATVSDEMKTSFKTEGYIGLGETITNGTPTYTPTPAVDTEASEVSVTSVTTYTMLGIKEDDVKKLVEKEAGKKLDTQKQSLLSTGLDDATFQIGTKKGTKLDVGVKTKVVAGPDFDQNEISQEIGGKKRGEAEEILKTRPGVKEVKVETKPFWNSKVPKKPSKITYLIQQADGSAINP